MPLGLRAVGEAGPDGGQYVVWAWVINGFFSVVGSLVGTILIMMYEFDLVMTLAFLMYLIGTLPVTKNATEDYSRTT